MFLFLFSLIFILLSRQRSSQVYILLLFSWLLVFIHSSFLFFQHDAFFFGSDTLFYYNGAIDIASGGNGQEHFSYFVYSYLNYLFTFPFTGLNGFYDGLIIRLTNVTLWSIVILIIYPSFKIKELFKGDGIIILAIVVIAIWYSLFNIRDNYLAMIFLLIASYWSKGAKGCSLIVILLLSLCVFFRIEFIFYFLCSLFCAFIIVRMARKIKFKNILFLTVMFFSTSVFTMKFISFPTWAQGYILRILTVQESDINRNNATNVNVADELNSGSYNVVGKVIWSKYVKGIPVLIFRDHPINTYLTTFKSINVDRDFNYSFISGLFLLFISSFYYFLFIPILIVFLIFNKNNKFQDQKTITFFIFFMVVNTVYTLKFGSTQSRVLYISILPLLLLLKDKCFLTYNSKIIMRFQLFITFPVVILYFLLYMLKFK